VVVHVDRVGSGAGARQAAARRDGAAAQSGRYARVRREGHGSGVAGAAGNFNVAATISPFAGQQTAIVTVTATNPATGHSTEKQVTVRLAQPR
jgi:hypothetical protein